MSGISKKHRAEFETTVKENVFKAVLRIAEKRPSDELTMEMISRESGISVGNLYNYFKNKGDLITYTILKFFEPYDKIEAEIAGGDMSVPDKLLAIAELTLSFNDEVGEFLAVTSKGLLTSRIQPVKEVNESRKRTMDRIGRIIEEGLRQEVFRDIAAKDILMSFFGITRGVVVRRDGLPPEANRPIAEDAELIMKMFMHGVARR